MLVSNEKIYSQNVDDYIHAHGVDHSQLDEAFHASDSEYVDVVVKFDTACSHNMSGHPARLDPDTVVVRNVVINGFNKSASSSTTLGDNEDGKKEYFVQSMPKHLALLCAHEYTKGGAAVLFPDGGKVIQMTPAEQQQLREFIKPYPLVKKLVVNNRTYEVERKSDLTDVTSPTVESANNAENSEEEAHSSTATRYFNTKVHVSNQQERVLATLLTGLSFRDLYSMVKHNSVDGLPRDLTMSALNHFEHKYGRTPDVLQLATPNLAGNVKGYLAPKVPLTRCGQRVEADYFESEINHPSTEPNSSDSFASMRKKTIKLTSHGGAVAAFVSVDVYSGYIHGELVKNLQSPVNQVKRTIDMYRIAKYKIETFAADQGVVTTSMFRAKITAVQALLDAEGINSECGEPYNHDNGTTHIERVGRTIHELQRFALMYVLKNPNFKDFGFSKLDILKLWGELFYWSLVIINMKPSPADPTKTKFEVFHGRKIDFREYRLLPIFSDVRVMKHSDNHELQSAQNHWKRGLYVGPSVSVKGAVRVAIMSNGQLKVRTSTAIKAVSDGGDINPYQTVDRALPSLIKDTANKDVVPPSSVHNIDVPDTDNVSYPLSIMPGVVPSTVNSDEPSPVTVRGSVETPPQSGEVDSDSESVKVSKSAQKNKKKGEAKKKVSIAKQTSEQTPVALPPEVNQEFSSPIRRHPKENIEVVRKTPLQYDPAKTSRDERMRNREARLEAYFVDWSDHEEGTYYWSFDQNCYVIFEARDPNTSYDEVGVNNNSEECYKAVTGPRSFAQALLDPDWSTAAQTELRTIVDETKAVVSCDQDIARENIKNGADVLRMIAVYEEKIKNGELVRKVRLVADGRRHTKHGPTYAATPSREELFIMLHILAADDMDYYVIDQVRAFLSAKKRDEHVTYAKFSGDSKFYEILHALYGMKTASRDHQLSVVELLTELGFERLAMCASIYKYKTEDFCILVYVYVDDFIFAGSCNEKTMEYITRFREKSNTSEPELNKESFLGLEITRDKSKRLILVTMKKKIAEVCARFSSAVMKYATDVYPNGELKKRHVPIPTTGYIVKDYEFENISELKSRILNTDEITIYMQIVGSLIWIEGVRMDIIFAVLYLTWFTKVPRQHHMDMAEYCLGYLANTIDVPLVLGGSTDKHIVGYTDASLATGPKGKSITASLVKLHEKAGAVSARTSATSNVPLSSFEAELEGTARLFKHASAVSNVIEELGINVKKPHLLHSDNDAMIKFVKGEGVAKGVRHMEMRMWYLRDLYAKGKFDLQHMPGNVIPTDFMTKLGTINDHKRMQYDVMGLGLLGPEYGFVCPTGD